MSMESFQTTEPIKPVETGGEKEKILKKKRVVIVDTSEALEDQARDIAEERLTASKEGLKGMKGFFSKIWKHNLFREYYRQKEIALAKAEIEESGNLYVGENADQTAHDEAVNSIVDRFVREYEETIHTEAGEKRKIVGNENADDQHLNISVRALIREFASGRIDEEVFKEERNRIVADATGLEGDELKNTVRYTDNLLEVARQSKMAVEHGASLDDIDMEIEVVIGKAKVGVRTESKYNTVDRISAKIQSSKIGQYLNEATINSGVAIAYGITVGLSQKLARSRALAWGTFGASALVGGVVAGARESVKVEDERRQHSRERAKGKEMTEEMTRRMEMEKVIYKTTPAKSLIESIKSTSERILGPEDFFGAVRVLAEAEARIKLSDSEQVDLISYTNFKSIEGERLNLDIARAEAKVKLRKMVVDGTIDLPDGKSFDEFYTSTIEIQTTGLREGEEGMETRDRLFKKMKRKKVAGAAFKAVATGLVVGGIAQEASAFFSDTKEGFVEHLVGHNDHAPKSVTALEGIRRWIAGEKVAERAMHHVTLPDGSNVNLPDGVDIIPNPNAFGEFLFTKDGEIVSDKIEFSGGKLTQASEEILKQNEVHISNAVTHVTNHEEIVGGPKDVIDKHPDLFHKIHRKFWYDNDTPKSDLNELKTHFGGVAGTGIDSHGNYVLSVAKMTSDGSFHKDLSVDAQELMKEGKLKILLSLSKDSQFNVVEVPINEQGQAIIDPNSEIGKMFFANDGGHLKFMGKYMEIAQSIGKAKDGAETYNLLSTVVGPGQEAVKTVKDVIVDSTVTSFEVTDHLPYVEPPVVIPIFGRTPMEKMKNPGKGVIEYAYDGFSSIKRKDYEYRMSESLKKNPDANLDEKKEIKDYLARQEKTHLAYINALASEAGPMSPECRLSICIPVAGHQEEKNIYRTLENYLYQTADKKDFELVLFVNHPDKDKEGKPVIPDGTMTEIARFIKDHPEMKVALIYRVIPIEKARMGYLRKSLNDAVLRRHIDRGETAPNHVIVSNDADNKGIAREYIQNFIEKFEKHPEVDSYMGQLDWDPQSYVRNPLVHIGTRLFQYVDAQLRSTYKNNIPSAGANFAFRSGMYAAVNGYSSDFDLAEDVDLGRAIKASRINAKNKRAIDFAGARVSRLFTSSRRAEKAIKDGLSPVEQWNKGFSAFDDEVRKVDWESLSKGVDYDNKESVQVLVDQLENVINRTMKAMTWVQADHEVFKRSLGWLGVKYKLVGVNQIKIVDASRLVKGLKQYALDVDDLMKKKTK